MTEPHHLYHSGPYGGHGFQNHLTTPHGLRLSRIGLGCYPFTDHWNNNLTSDQAIITLIRLAISNGINVIDTSEMHGNGHIESLVGKAIKGRRHQVAIVTKGGFLEKPGVPGEWVIDASGANVAQAIDRSLRRLGVDYIDYYLSHFPDPHTPLQETLQALQKAQRAGKIIGFGFSNYSAAGIQQALELAPELAVLQHHYSLLDRSIERDILPISRKAEKMLMAYRVVERGLLTGHLRTAEDTARANYTMFQKRAVERALQKVTALKDLAAAYGRTPAQVALRWALDYSGVPIALIGVSSKTQLLEAVGAMGWELRMHDAEHLSKLFATP